MAGEPQSEDEPVRMTVKERTVWASLVAIIVSACTYFALMVPRLLSRPVTEISWVGPMTWTISLAIVGSIVLTIGVTIVAEARRAGGCSPTSCGEVTSDIRDQEIDQRGGRTSMGVISVGLGSALVLAMLDAHPFWIGNLLFLFGTAGTVVEATMKILLYRRGF